MDPAAQQQQQMGGGGGGGMTMAQAQMAAQEAELAFMTEFYNK
jgi:hypothetical protein